MHENKLSLKMMINSSKWCYSNIYYSLISNIDIDSMKQVSVNQTNIFVIALIMDIIKRVCINVQKLYKDTQI